VKVKFADFRQVTRSCSFPGSIARQDLLQQASVELVRMVLPTMKGVRRHCHGNCVWQVGPRRARLAA